MNKRSPLSDVMTREVIVANLDNRYSQVMEFFNTWRIQHLPVTFNDQLLGIVSINDMLSFAFYCMRDNSSVNMDILDEKFDIKKVMTADPVTAKPEDTLEDAIRILAEGKFQALPVVKDGKLVGIVTNKDLVKVAARIL